MISTSHGPSSSYSTALPSRIWTKLLRLMVRSNPNQMGLKYADLTSATRGFNNALELNT